LKKLSAAFPLLVRARHQELLRVPCNALPALPAALGRHPKLTWLSVAGNPVCPALAPAAPVPEVEAPQLVFAPGAQPLGQGASGGAFAATWHRPGGGGGGDDAAPLDIVVKRFVAGVSPDGAPADEVEAACAVAHARCVRVLALMRSPTLALVMAPAPGAPLGGRPGGASVLRCTYDAATRFAPAVAAAAAADVAAALAACHAAGVAHGDVYAHNILLSVPSASEAAAAAAAEAAPAPAAVATLCDFGAAFAYSAAAGGVDVERLEARAFGLLLADLAARVEEPAGRGQRVADALAALSAACTAPDVASRPRFEHMAATLAALL
jgi:hypothetical protein